VGTKVKLAYDGSKALKNNMHERYAKHRAAALPRIAALRKAGCIAKNDNIADRNSSRLEKKPGVRERIDYLVGQAQERIAEKRAALEEQLWAVMEADIGAFWETYEAAKTGKDGKLATDQDGKMALYRKMGRYVLASSLLCCLLLNSIGRQLLRIRRRPLWPVKKGPRAATPPFWQSPVMHGGCLTVRSLATRP
jgi:hypothetical protein